MFQIKHFSIFIMIIISSAIFFSCKDSITDPLNKPGSRNYTWTIDTIKTGTEGYVFFMRMWGSSPTDIWAVGESDVGSNTTWHYDGKTWYNIKERMYAGDAIFGFASNNVWRANNNNEMWHYDGYKWSRHTTFELEGFDQIQIINIWGQKPNDIYAVGFARTYQPLNYIGIIFHFNGDVWENLDITKVRAFFARIAKQVSEEKFVIEAIAFDSSGSTIFKNYTFDGKNINEIYTSTTDLQTIGFHNGQVYSVLKQKIYKYSNDKFILWKDFSGSEMIGEIWFRNENDFFCMSRRGVGHYNGTDYKTLLEFDFLITGAQIFEKDVFFIAVDPNTSTNVLIHGKLND